MNRIKNYLSDKENRIVLSVIIITLIIASLPLFSKYCVLGHDSEYHLLRIEALKEGILRGTPFLKINVLFFGDAGYASSMFYPDFLLYIPAVLRVIGASINTSWHIFIFACIALCFVSAYFSAFFMTKNKYAALVSGILFTFCSYHIDNIYVRAAAGEYTAFIFLPLFLYGLYNLCFEDMDKPQLLALSLAGILLCHTLSFVLCILITAAALIINYRVFKENKRLLPKLIITAVITIALTASYLFPMLEQLLTDKFYVSKPWIEPAQEAKQITGLFEFLFPTIGIGLLLFILPRIILKGSKNDKLMKFADECILAGLLLAIISTDIFPWKRFGQYVSVIQFPWRLFQLSSALLAMAGVIVVYRLGCYVEGKLAFNGNHKGKADEDNTSGCSVVWQLMTIIVLLVMVFTCFYSYTKQNREYYDYSNDYYDYKPFTASVIAGEWLPERVTDPELLVEQSEYAYNSEGDSVPFTRKKNKIIFTSDGSGYTDVPFIYYKGYSAKSSAGQVLKVDGGAENGFTRVYSDGINDDITVYYKGTTIQMISRILSIASFICLMMLRSKVLWKLISHSI